jgi:hypothetical protein
MQAGVQAPYVAAGRTENLTGWDPMALDSATYAGATTLSTLHTDVPRHGFGVSPKPWHCSHCVSLQSLSVFRL